MVAPLAKPVRRFLATLKRQESGFLWTERVEEYVQDGGADLGREFKDMETKAGIDDPDVTFHCLRYFFVSQIKLSGADQRVAKAMARHATNVISDHYTDLPLKVLRAVVEQLQLPE